MSLEPARGDILLHFFAYLEARGIPYCVVGDSKHYPEKIESDVDIVVPEEIVPFCPSLVQAFAKVEGIYLVQNLHHEQNAWYLVLTWRALNTNYSFLSLDISGNYFHNGRCFLEARKLLERRTRSSTDTFEDKGFYIPAPEKEFTYYLLKKISKGNLNSQQFDHLRSQYSKAPISARAALLKFFSKGEVDFISALLSNGDRAVLSGAFPTLQDSLFHRVRLSKRLLTGDYWRKLWRVLKPTGLMVVFTGSDGSGKSTVMKIVEQQLRPAFRQIQKYHLQPRLFRKDVVPSAFTNPHSESPRGSFGSLLKLVYLSLDYCLGYFFKVFPQLVCSSLVLFDRYYHDVLVDPKRFRCKDLAWFARLIGKLIPKPDLWLLFDADPQILQKRKRELPFQETCRQREGYFELIKSFPNGFILDASKSIEDVAAQANELILKQLALRNENRLKSAAPHAEKFSINSLK